MSPSALTVGIQPLDHARIGESQSLPTGGSTAYISVCPIVIPSTRPLPIPLQVKISYPSNVVGSLPILLLSHGHGYSNYLSSLNGCAPLATFFASHGFLVIQPTHLGSGMLDIPAGTPGVSSLFYDSRPQDMRDILDHLDLIESTGPGLAGKLDRNRVAVMGFSMGGHTASMLLGMTVKDPHTEQIVNKLEPRIKAGVILGGTGNGGESLSKRAFDNYTFLKNPNFGTMTTPALVIYGDEDASEHLTVRGAEWHKDAYVDGPGATDAFELKGGKHILGGVSGYDVSESQDDESPERVAAVNRVSWAYLMSKLYDGDESWDVVKKALGSDAKTLGTVESKA